MRLIETQSKWGNSYKRRYYVDGKRVTESEFDSLLKSESRYITKQGVYEPMPYGFRTIWEST